MICESNRRLSPAVIEVLCAFVDLKDEAQRSFNGALNDYLLASPVQRRKFAQRWHEVLREEAAQAAGDELK